MNAINLDITDRKVVHTEHSLRMQRQRAYLELIKSLRNTQACVRVQMKVVLQVNGLVSAIIPSA